MQVCVLFHSVRSQSVQEVGESVGTLDPADPDLQRKGGRNAIAGGKN